MTPLKPGERFEGEFWEPEPVRVVQPIDMVRKYTPDQRTARRKALAEVRIDKRISYRASRAKPRPVPVRLPGCVPFPRPHDHYSTDGVHVFNRKGEAVKSEVSPFTGLAYAKLYCAPGVYKKYPLLETYETQKTLIRG